MFRDYIYDSGSAGDDVSAGTPMRLFGIPISFPSLSGIKWPEWGKLFKEYIYDGGSAGDDVSAGTPMRLFGIPLVFPSLPNINWPDWGALFKKYIYDGSVEGQIKILGFTISWPTLSEDFSLLDLLPGWLRNPKEFFTGWFKGVKSFFGFGDEDTPEAMTAKMAENQAIIDKLLAKETSGATVDSILAGATSLKDLQGLGGRASPQKTLLFSAIAENQELAKNIDKMTLNSRPRLGVALIDAQGKEIFSSDFMRNAALMGSLGPAAAMGGGGGSQSIVVDGKQTHVSNIAIDATSGTSDPTTYATSTAVP
jgi:hypothetical protein